jgi:hypothetical protein
MMKLFYKITALTVVIFAFILIPFDQTVTYADHQKSVFSAVETASQQGVPEEVINRLLAYALDNQLSGKHTVQLLSVMIEVHKAKLPIDPFVEKIQEGLAKQVPPEKLVNSLNKRLNNYKFVKELLKKKYVGTQNFAESVLSVFVESLDFGLTKEELSLLINTAPQVPPQMLSIAAKNKALLRQLTFEEKFVDDILFIGLKYQSFTSRWSLFFKVVMAAERKGISQARIANASKDILSENGDLEEVLTVLGFSSRDVRHGPHLDSPPDVDEGDY